MSDQLSMKYSDMNKAIADLTRQLSTFKQTTNDMSKSVSTLCNGWTANASSIYREDYTKLTKNFGKTADVVEKLIKSTSDYIKDMEGLDKAYSKSKVN